jgi:hypothetical protein
MSDIKRTAKPTEAEISAAIQHGRFLTYLPPRSGRLLASIASRRQLEELIKWYRMSHDFEVANLLQGFLDQTPAQWPKGSKLATFITPESFNPKVEP